jgi:exo-1,4-beta-D-glucosaminidase
VTRFARDTTLTVPADSGVRAFTLPAPEDLSSTYFADLRLADAAGRTVSTNLYWLSTAPEEMDFGRSTGWVTPARSYADFTALHDLPPAAVRAAVLFTRRGSEETAHVTLTNAGSAMAFFVRLQVVTEPDGEEVLPVLWEDNDVSLLPGESRELTARYRRGGAAGSARALVVSGWNVARVEVR